MLGWDMYIDQSHLYTSILDHYTCPQLIKLCPTVTRYLGGELTKVIFLSNSQILDFSASDQLKSKRGLETDWTVDMGIRLKAEKQKKKQL